LTHADPVITGLPPSYPIGHLILPPAAGVAQLAQHQAIKEALEEYQGIADDEDGGGLSAHALHVFDHQEDTAGQVSQHVGAQEEEAVADESDSGGGGGGVGPQGVQGGPIGHGPQDRHGAEGDDAGHEVHLNQMVLGDHHHQEDDFGHDGHPGDTKGPLQVGMDHLGRLMLGNQSP